MTFVVLDRMEALRRLADLGAVSDLARAVGRAILVLTNPRTGIATDLTIERILRWTSLSFDEVKSGVAELERSGHVLRPRPDAYCWAERFCLGLPRLQHSPSRRPARHAAFHRARGARSAGTQRCTPRDLAAAHRQWR